MATEKLVIISEELAEKLKEWDYEAEVVYAVPRELIELLGKVQANAPARRHKLPSRRKNAKQVMSMHLASAARGIRSRQNGKSAIARMEDVLLAQMKPKKTYKRDELKTMLADKGFTAQEASWGVGAMVHQLKILISDD